MGMLVSRKQLQKRNSGCSLLGIYQAVLILPWEEREAALKGGITNPPGQDSTAAGMLCATGFKLSLV